MYVTGVGLRGGLWGGAGGPSLPDPPPRPRFHPGMGLGPLVSYFIPPQATGS